MANYQLLKADIDEKVYQNGRQEITGENLNSVLNAMVTTLGAEYQFAGVATIDTNPGTPDAKVFYIANGKGTYTNFGSLEVTEDEVVVLYWDSAWHKVSTGIASHEKLTELATKTDGIESILPIQKGGNLYNKYVNEVKNIAATSSVIFANNNGISAIIELNAESGDIYSCKNIGGTIQPNGYYLISTDDYSEGAAIKQRASGNYNTLQGYINMSSNAKYVLVNVNFDHQPSQSEIDDFKNTLVFKKQADIPTEYEPAQKLNVGFDELSQDVNDEFKQLEKSDSDALSKIEDINSAINFSITDNLFDKNKNSVLNIGATGSIVLAPNTRGVSAIVEVNALSGDSFAARMFDDSLAANVGFYIVATNGYANGDRVIKRSTSTGSLMQNKLLDIGEDAKYIIACINFSTDITDEQIEKFKQSLVIVKGVTLPSVYLPAKKFVVNESNLSEGLKKKLSLSWSDKNIVWYGTSIPQGANTMISFDGNPVSALGTADRLNVYDGKSIPNQYPVVVGSILGANIYNEAVESSRVVPNRTHPNLQLRCKALGNKVSEIISWLFGSYNINWQTHVYSRNTDNTIGITSWFGDSTWEVLMWQFYTCLRYSYELSIVARYLIKDDTERTNYAKGVMGEGNYNALRDAFASAGYDMANLIGHKADIDLFVFDHGHNDGIEKFTSDTSDMSFDTFEGCMNNFIGLIKYYQPNAMIASVSDYTNYREGEDRIAYQKAMAERWQLPFIDLRGFLPLCLTHKTITRGYWSSDRKWHDKGFTWSESGGTYSSNNQFADMLNNTQKIESMRANTLANVKAVFNPHQLSDGTWVWDAYPLCLWLYDGLHPSSDTEGRMTKMYGNVLAKWIETL